MSRWQRKSTLELWGVPVASVGVRVLFFYTARQTDELLKRSRIWEYLCVNTQTQKKKAILFSNICSWLISSMYVPSQCTMHFHTELLVRAHDSPTAPLGTQHDPTLRKRKPKLRGWRLAYGPMIRSDGASPLSCSLQSKGLQHKGQERGRMMVCATEHWPREDDCHCQGGPRGLGLRNTGQPPLRWLSEKGASPCSCWWAHLSSRKQWRMPGLPSSVRKHASHLSKQ